MTWNLRRRRTCLNILGALILALGLGSAAVIYLRAGVVHDLMPENSKLYARNLEVYGGKFMVIMDDFRRWLVGLWQGKPLAVIIGCTAVMLAWALFAAAKHGPQRSGPGEGNGNGQDRLD